MKRRVSGIIAGVALAAGAGLAAPTTAGALDDPFGDGLPVVYEAPVTPEVAQFVADTGIAAAVSGAGYAIPGEVGWLIRANAEMLDDVSADIVYDGYACGEIGMRAEAGLLGVKDVIGTSYATC